MHYENIMYYENIIIGAGPAGLQAGYYLHKYELDYIILEKGGQCGSSFESLPHSNRLLSINKKNTGSVNKDINLKYDYNSLLNDKNIMFTKYSNHYYPNRDDMITYLNEYRENNFLNVEFDSLVVKIEKINEDEAKLKLNYQITVKRNDIEEYYECDRLFMATGLSAPVIPENFVKLSNGDNSNIKHYGQFSKDYFVNNTYINQKILIIGNGNSAHELYNMLYTTASEIIIAARDPMSSMNSNYFGSINSMYLRNDIIIDHNHIDKFHIDKVDGKYFVYFKKINSQDTEGVYLDGSTFDEIILCTGWKLDTSIFSFHIETTKNGKYPILGINYGAIGNKNLYFIGEAMHLFDYRNSSGGFIHGFRYLIKSCIHQQFGISTKNSFKKFDIFNNNGFHLIHFNKFIKYIIDRLNTASSLFHMHGILSDKFYLMANGDILYIKDVHINNMIDIETRVKEMENMINSKNQKDKDPNQKDSDPNQKDKDPNQKDSDPNQKDKNSDIKISPQLRILQMMENRNKKNIIEPTIKPVEEPTKEIVELNVMLFSLTLEYDSRMNNKIYDNKIYDSIHGDNKIYNSIHSDKQNESRQRIHPVLRVFSTKLKKFIDIIHFDDNIFDNFSNNILYHDKIARIIKGYIIMA